MKQQLHVVLVNVAVLMCFMSWVVDSKTTNVIWFEELKECSDVRTPITNFSAVINIIGRTQSAFSVNFTLTKDIPTLTLLEVISRKCHSHADTNCEHAARVKIANPCKLMPMEGQFWSNLYKKVQPTIKCPGKKGFYKIENYEIDNQRLMSYLPVNLYMDYVWRPKVKLWNGPELLLCFSGTYEILKRRT